MKISVIMPVHITEEYPGCASNRQEKLIRAVDSFLAQSHEDKELIVATDGCPTAVRIIKEHYPCKREIVLLELERHPLFTGAVRQKAIDAATGDILCNLDADDYFERSHLTSIAYSFPEDIDWAYWNHYIRPDNIKDVNHLWECDGTLERMNNASYAWRRGLPVTWEGCDGRQDNKQFIPQLLELPNRKKIFGCGYIVTNIQIK